MANVHYRIVGHEDGCAYKAGDVLSERYATHEEARDAAERVAAGQRLPRATEDIEHQDDIAAGSGLRSKICKHQILSVR